MRNKMKYLILLLCFSTACSVTREKCILKYGDFTESIILRTDTITIEKIKRDTIVDLDSFMTEKPIIIERDKLRVEVQRIKDKVYIKGECKTDTIIVEKTILQPRMDKMLETQDKNTVNPIIFYVICGIGIIVLLGMFLYKLIKG